MSDAASLPAVFLGHGSPMNAIETNRFTEAWAAFGTSIPTPRAILVVSAHWYIEHTAVTAMASPRTIHDFGGFPQALFDAEYPAPGAPEVAAEVSEIAKPVPVGLDQSWGIDHGAWSVLVHAFPQADVPVVQLSINAREPLDYHLDLGARLAPLRRQGVLIMGSGNVVHNLRRIDWGQPDAAYDWAQRFNESAIEVMTGTPADVPTLVSHPDYRLAAPTPEHFLPLLYVAGVAAEIGRGADVLVDGYSMGSLSMSAFTVNDAATASTATPEASEASEAAGRTAEGAALLPDPAVVPPTQTNA